MRAFFCSACFALLVAAAPQTGFADEDPAATDLDAARELFFEGQSFAGEGRWAEARDRFQRSLAIKRSAITLYSLGVAELESGLLVEAIASLQAFLAEPTTDATEPYRQPAEAALAELEARVPRLTIRVRPADAPGLQVKVDGEEIPGSALLGGWIANPGRHRVEVTAEGYQPSEQRLALAEGSVREIVVDLLPSPEAPATAPIEEPGAATPVMPIVFIVVGGATLGVATGLGVAALSEARDAPSQDGAQADGARTKGLAADVLFGVGGVVTAIGLVYLAVELTSDVDARARGPVQFGPEGLRVTF